MKNNSLKKMLLANQLNSIGNNENKTFQIINPDFLEHLHGGIREYSECTTHSGDCSELTSCGTYGSNCNSKCGLKFSETV